MSAAIRGAPVRPRIHRAARTPAARPLTRARAVDAPARAEKSTKQSGKGYRVGVDTLNTFLFREEQRGVVSGDLAIIVNNIAVACKKISNLVAVAPILNLTGLAGSSNESGDEQKKLDVISNDIFCDAMSDTCRANMIVTEEEDVPSASRPSPATTSSASTQSTGRPTSTPPSPPLHLRHILLGECQIFEPTASRRRWRSAC